LAEVVLLGVAAGLMLLRPGGLPFWVGPVAAASVGVVTTIVDLDTVGDALDPMAAPLLFLVFAVPLAVALDRLGVFAALAALVDGGRHLALALWVFGAVVVIVFNLDAAVLLLTPLYIRIAGRHGYAPEAFAFQPALLACLASGLLPVSNLTNLIVAEQFDLGVVDFVRAMWLPTVVAVAVGFAAYRRVFDVEPRRDAVDDVADRRALRRGLPIVAFVLVGFTGGEIVGIDAWVVAAVACVWTFALARHVFVRAVPVTAVAVAAALAVLAAAAAPHLPLDWFFAATGPVGDLRLVGFGTFGANVANNLPTVLVGGARIEQVDQVWPLLLGVNIGAVLTITGSLSGLLWRDTAARSGVAIGAGRYASVGLRVGAPALVAATVAVLI
jgi:arsenical pump membrane protein